MKINVQIVNPAINILIICAMLHPAIIYIQLLDYGFILNR